MSLNREAAMSIKNTSGKEGLTADEKTALAELKQDVRKAHFDLGSHNLAYDTTAGSSMVPHTITQQQVVNADMNRRNQID